MEESQNKEQPSQAGRKSEAISKEIFELEKQLVEKKMELEKGIAPPEEKPALPSPAPAVSVPVKAPAAKKKKSIIESNAKVKVLVDKAFHEGVAKAIEEVKRTNDAYLIDAFHDALIDEVYNTLLKEGLLKEM